MRAIIVEDDPQVSSVTQLMLKKLGFQVVEADQLVDGADVLLRLSKEPPPELLVIDIRLPGQWDGIEVMVAVRNAGVRGATPAIILTSGIAEPTAGNRRVIAEHNAVFLPKPYSLADLEAAALAAHHASTDWTIKTLDEDLPAVSA